MTRYKVDYGELLWQGEVEATSRFEAVELACEQAEKEGIYLYHEEPKVTRRRGRQMPETHGNPPTIDQAVGWLTDMAEDDDEGDAIGHALAVALEAMRGWGDFTFQDFEDFLAIELVRQQAFARGEEPDA